MQLYDKFFNITNQIMPCGNRKKNYKINRFFGSNEFSASYVITNIWAFKLTPNHNDIAVFD